MSLSDSLRGFVRRMRKRTHSLTENDPRMRILRIESLESRRLLSVTLYVNYHDDAMQTDLATAWASSDLPQDPSDPNYQPPLNPNEIDVLKTGILSRMQNTFFGVPGGVTLTTTVPASGSYEMIEFGGFVAAPEFYGQANCIGETFLNLRDVSAHHRHH